MSEIKQTFIVERDGEIDLELSVLPATGIDAALENVKGAVSGMIGHIGLQARMAVFDARHGTNYRQIRNNLVEQKRRTEFERSIGLVAIHKK